MLPNSIRVVALTLLLLILSGCNQSDPDTLQVKSLRFGVLPDQSPEQLKARYHSLLKFLSEETGIDCQLVLSDSYLDLLERFHNKQIDIARFGGFSFIKAHKRDDAVPMVMRDIDTRFVSYFLVNKDNSANSLQDLHGKTLGFGSVLSTSGHLMPRHFMQREGIVPEHFFDEVRYSGSHDRTAEWVAKGEVDVGVANSIVVENLLAQGKLTTDQIRVLSRTPPYADYVWAAQKSLDESVRYQIINAFLKLSSDTPAMDAILKTVGARHYVPATVDDFAIIEQTAELLHLL